MSAFSVSQIQTSISSVEFIQLKFTKIRVVDWKEIYDQVLEWLLLYRNSRYFLFSVCVLKRLLMGKQKIPAMAAALATL